MSSFFSLFSKNQRETTTMSSETSSDASRPPKKPRTSNEVTNDRPNDLGRGGSGRGVLRPRDLGLGTGRVDGGNDGDPSGGAGAAAADGGAPPPPGGADALLLLAQLFHLSLWFLLPFPQFLLLPGCPSKLNFNVFI
jgi:hypothetical protein